jgi:large subunit ribosomal protein L25
LRINPSETLRANVPLLTEGVSEGVRNEGGALQQTLTSIEMECVVSEMPSAMVIDISSLVIGDSLHVSDLVEQEPRITTDPARTIVNILAPRLITEEEEAEEAEVPEGEEEAGEGDEGGEADAGGEE